MADDLPGLKPSAAWLQGPCAERAGPPALVMICGLDGITWGYRICGYMETYMYICLGCITSDEIYGYMIYGIWAIIAWLKMV
jgi:hypothetical protein